MLDFSLLLRQLIFQSLDVRSHCLLLGVQSFDHLHTEGISKKSVTEILPDSKWTRTLAEDQQNICSLKKR